MSKTEIIKPLGNWIQLELLKSKKAGKIVLLDKKLRYDKGRVIAVGPGKITSKGVLVPPGVRVGDIVLFQHLCPQVQTPLLDTTILVSEEEIYCTFSEEDELE